MDARWELVSVYDADSFHVNGYLHAQVAVGLPGYEGRAVGLEMVVQEMIRVVLVNAAELDAPGGRAARDAVRAWFAREVDPTNVPLLLKGRDKYKRLLADVVLPDGRKLSQFILSLSGSVPMKLFDQVREP
jgi:endonuclease YncB( thermonuclease family)